MTFDAFSVILFVVEHLRGIPCDFVVLSNQLWEFTINLSLFFGLNCLENGAKRMQKSKTHPIFGELSVQFLFQNKNKKKSKNSNFFSKFATQLIFTKNSKTKTEIWSELNLINLQIIPNSIKWQMLQELNQRKKNTQYAITRNQLFQLFF